MGAAGGIVLQQCLFGCPQCGRGLTGLEGYIEPTEFALTILRTPTISFKDKRAFLAQVAGVSKGLITPEAAKVAPNAPGPVKGFWQRHGNALKAAGEAFQVFGAIIATVAVWPQFLETLGFSSSHPTQIIEILDPSREPFEDNVRGEGFDNNGGAKSQNLERDTTPQQLPSIPAPKRNKFGIPDKGREHNENSPDGNRDTPYPDAGWTIEVQVNQGGKKTQEARNSKPRKPLRVGRKRIRGFPRP